MARDEQGNVFFDADEQAVVDKAVQERLDRDRKSRAAEKPADYDDLSSIAAQLQELGYAGTPAQVNEALRKDREAQRAQRELQEAEARAHRNGTSPELEKEITRLQKIVEENEAFISSKKMEDEQRKRTAEQEKEADRQWNENVKEFETAYPDVTISSLANDKRFVAFAEGKKGPLVKIYERYLEFAGDDKGAAKARDKESRSTGSGSGSRGREYGLSAEQKATLAEWNRRNPNLQMTEKEFAERM